MARVLLGKCIYSTGCQMDACMLCMTKGNEMGWVTIWQGIKSHMGNCGEHWSLDSICNNLSAFNESQLEIKASFIMISQIQKILSKEWRTAPRKRSPWNKYVKIMTFSSTKIRVVVFWGVGCHLVTFLPVVKIMLLLQPVLYS